MIYLFGTDHSLQHNGRVAYTGAEFDRLKSQFPKQLESSILKCGANIIAEESNQDVLDKFNASHSVANLIAEKLNIKHVFCEPNLHESEILKIKHDGSQEDFEKRENHWLEKLAPYKDNIILFIIGCKHVQSFKERAEEDAHTVEVEEECYGQSYFCP